MDTTEAVAAIAAITVGVAAIGAAKLLARCHLRWLEVVEGCHLRLSLVAGEGPSGPLSFFGGCTHVGMVCLMRWTSRTAHILFGLTAFVILILSAPAQAQDVRTTARATGYVRMGTNAQGGTIWGTQTQFESMWQSVDQRPCSEHNPHALYF